MDSEKDSRKRSSCWVVRSVKMVSCSPISLHLRTGKRAQLSVPQIIAWAIAPSGTMYALTVSCTVATQKAPKHCTFNRITLAAFRGIPLNPDHLRSRGRFAPQMATQRPTQAYSRKINTIQTTVGNPYQLTLCLAESVSHAVPRLL